MYVINVKRIKGVFVESACGERYIVVTMTVRCMCVRQCVRPSEIVRTITSTIVVGFQNNLTQLFSITCICATPNIYAGRSMVKVTQARQVVLAQPSSFY